MAVRERDERGQRIRDLPLARPCRFTERSGNRKFESVPLQQRVISKPKGAAGKKNPAEAGLKSFLLPGRLTAAKVRQNRDGTHTIPER